MNQVEHFFLKLPARTGLNTAFYELQEIEERARPYRSPLRGAVQPGNDRYRSGVVRHLS